MTYIRPNDPGDLFVRALEDAGATPQKTARFAHLRTTEGRLAATLFMCVGAVPATAIDPATRTERRLHADRPRR